MKKFTCILLILFASSHAIKLPPELQEYVDDLHRICIAQTGITDADHAAYDIVNNPHDSKLMCYMKCLMIEAKWMKPDGEIQYDFIIDTIHPDVKDIIVTALNKCRSIPEGDNLCQKASNLNFCLYGADPVNWYLV
ncbi:pheromone-binding protein-related protein 6-like [Diorhabda sublineata]|uniref:pheromone-binding protein-related protein 6-like n=1 Tax=Diorhabda sublineata TaxID=1163346 RepID=UPI0024E123C1|nr:pheromone-binding protein-related protein 6-like [Diorhabda sublineata]